jgi:hypothetical protein
MAPGLDAWLDLMNTRVPVASEDHEKSRNVLSGRVEVGLTTWAGAQGLEADVALLALTRPPVAETAAQLLYVGITRARQVVRILVTEDVAPAWVEEFLKQGITYREAGNEAT